MKRRELMMAGVVAATVPGALLKAASAPRVLVVSYSRVGETYSPDGPVILTEGHTAKMARWIADQTNADWYEIRTGHVYPQVYEDLTQQAKEEQTKDFRPPLAAPVPQMADYDVVFLGHPIWWGKLPPVVKTFLSEVRLDGKKVIHFCTHGGSAFAQSTSEIRALAPKAQLQEGLALLGHEVDASQARVVEWLNDLGYAQKP